MAQGDPRKWHMPGWRIEQKYSPGVLIGNWDEDRYMFQRGNQKHNSTHRVDFRNYGGHRPDVVVRRKALLRNDGLGPENLFWHHGQRYTNNMLSWYDEHYNGRWQENNFPPSRQWNSHQLAWGPEKSDYPLQVSRESKRGGANPTNFGLLQSLQEKWKSQIADETRGDFQSTYSSSFAGHNNDAMTRVRYAVPREQSTNLHPVNKVNKDLHFRGVSALKSPEKLPEMPLRSMTVVG
ncbi:cilia- and flagella-associated protein 107-like isoform X2 [Mercenaria mercenaria]|uniref:cilia- and flagella-associated protein 107-like isoform X2 n=1 Tax=Mercenaria mercenaria TaxID=6596 RepID=UPI001E1DE7D7|nr:cilia- and flagella-associated protein 107-like isoform X2 [Mercenaria mercenaria]